MAMFPEGKFTPAQENSTYQVSRRELWRERRNSNVVFREAFRRGTKEVDVPALGQSVRMVDIAPREHAEGPVKVVVPGWTENVKVLKPLIRAWSEQGERVLSYTPGKLLNPKKENYPQGITEALARLNLYREDERGRVAIEALTRHEDFPIHVQKALELLAVINTTDSHDKVKLHAHSQGLPVAIIAALLEPNKIDSIIGDAGAGTIGDDNLPKIGVRFVAHLVGSGLQGAKGSKDAFRTVRGGIGAITYAVRNGKNAIREGGVIASTDVYPALDYLDLLYDIKSALIAPTKDRLYPQHRVLATGDAHEAETGYHTEIQGIQGGHNDVYVRAENHVAVVADLWKVMDEEKAA